MLFAIIEGEEKRHGVHQLKQAKVGFQVLWLDGARHDRVVRQPLFQFGLKLSLLFEECSGRRLVAHEARDEHELPGVPRGSWNDLCAITWTRRDARTIVLDPYPFELDVLRVSMPTRVVPTHELNRSGPPLTRLHGAPLQTIDFTFISREG